MQQGDDRQRRHRDVSGGPSLQARAVSNGGAIRWDRPVASEHAMMRKLDGRLLGARVTVYGHARDGVGGARRAGARRGWVMGGGGSVGWLVGGWMRACNGKCACVRACVRGGDRGNSGR